MAILLAMIFGLNAILIVQIKVLTGLENSVIAFFAADTGIEHSLMAATSTTGSLDNGAEYLSTLISTSTPECLSTQAYCIKSIGTYRQTKRAIKITR